MKLISLYKYKFMFACWKATENRKNVSLASVRVPFVGGVAPLLLSYISISVSFSIFFLTSWSFLGRKSLV